jgi:hypothetical protein
MEGFAQTQPTIKKVSFHERGRIALILEDGRIISAPLSKFPSIRRLSVKDRQQYTIINGTMIDIHAANEVYHIQDFLGLPEKYAYTG